MLEQTKDLEAPTKDQAHGLPLGLQTIVRVNVLGSVDTLGWVAKVGLLVNANFNDTLQMWATAQVSPQLQTSFDGVCNDLRLGHSTEVLGPGTAGFRCPIHTSKK